MDRQALAKPLQWKALNTLPTILREESFLELWKKFSDIFKTSRINIKPSW